MKRLTGKKNLRAGLNKLCQLFVLVGHMSLHRHKQRGGKEGQVLHRSKRGWVWNQFFVIEEYTGPDPVLVGRVSIKEKTTFY